MRRFRLVIPSICALTLLGLLLVAGLRMVSWTANNAGRAPDSSPVLSAGLSIAVMLLGCILSLRSPVLGDARASALVSTVQLVVRSDPFPCSPGPDAIAGARAASSSTLQARRRRSRDFVAASAPGASRP